MGLDDDSTQKPKAELSSDGGGKRILIDAAMLTAGGIAVYLLVRHVLFVDIAAGQSDLIPCAIFLLWTWPLYIYMHRYWSMARSLALRESANESELLRLRAIIDGLPDLIYIKDTQSRFLLANPALRRFVSGKPDADLIGQTDFSFFPRETATIFFNDEQAIIRTGEPVVSQAERMQDFYGNDVWLLTTKIPFRGKDGNVAGIIGIGRNVTTQKQGSSAESVGNACRRSLYGGGFAAACGLSF